MNLQLPNFLEPSLCHVFFFGGGSERISDEGLLPYREVAVERVEHVTLWEKEGQFSRPQRHFDIPSRVEHWDGFDE